MRTVTRQKRITRADLRDNPKTYYLFGDNLKHVGYGGQAGQMRGEPNAIGVPTKKSPGMDDDDFFTDEEYYENIAHIGLALAKIPIRANIVIPSDGLGTGLAELPTRAPRTFAWLEERLKTLESSG